MASRRKDTLLTPSRGPSQRQLRVGEQVRHILSTLFLRSEFPEPGLPTSVTVTHVNMSPDLQNATVYIMPLGGYYREETLAYLKEIAGYVRHQLGKSLQTKFTPSLRFRLDESFDHAERIEKLLKGTER
ncbi:MAG: rbfA [Alphaproteobacteria bacterium]|jgi:ribosome-binding factor A|nr:rbfA [Alphaproteobacteria bacterium]